MPYSTHLWPCPRLVAECMTGSVTATPYTVPVLHPAWPRQACRWAVSSQFQKHSSNAQPCHQCQGESQRVGCNCKFQILPSLGCKTLQTLCTLRAIMLFAWIVDLFAYRYQQDPALSDFCKHQLQPVKPTFKLTEFPLAAKYYQDLSASDTMLGRGGCCSSVER